MEQNKYTISVMKNSNKQVYDFCHARVQIIIIQNLIMCLIFLLTKTRC